MGRVFCDRLLVRCVWEFHRLGKPCLDTMKNTNKAWLGAWVTFLVGLNLTPSCVQYNAEEVFANTVCGELGFDARCFTGPVKASYATYEWRNITPDDTIIVSVTTPPLSMGLGDKIGFYASNKQFNADSIKLHANCHH